MSLYYVDTSAALKLLVEEIHSKAFAAFYDGNAGSLWASSALLRIEVMRVVTRVLPSVIPEARDLLLAFDYISIDDDIINGAMNEPDRMLRSLDAIHLATMRILENDLDSVVTYDNRLAKAATDAGFAVISPQD
ncbi:MAG: type II toxin-antitoxin system VapC family toxin [Acidimicrobiales bacterium]